MKNRKRLIKWRRKTMIEEDWESLEKAYECDVTIYDWIDDDGNPIEFSGKSTLTPEEIAALPF